MKFFSQRRTLCDTGGIPASLSLDLCTMHAVRSSEQGRKKEGGHGESNIRHGAAGSMSLGAHRVIGRSGHTAGDFLCLCQYGEWVQPAEGETATLLDGDTVTSWNRVSPPGPKGIEEERPVTLARIAGPHSSAPPGHSPQTLPFDGPS